MHVTVHRMLNARSPELAGEMEPPAPLSAPAAPMGTATART
jgi:hypothetical protein